ncbi:unnamed protein product [Camellia sinensis]
MWICLDNKNQMINQTALVVHPLQIPLVAEAKACLEVVRWVVKEGMKCVTVQTDCQVMVRMLQKQGMETTWLIATIINDIIYYSKFFDYLCISKVGRDVIQLAHELATNAFKFK